MNEKKSPLVKQFKIDGLHGYKDVTIDFEDSVKIVIAENGAGKTTILSALDCFLRSDFFSLRNINFHTISCHFSGDLFPLVLEKKWLTSQSFPASNEIISEIVKYSGEEESVIYSYLMREFDKNDIDRIRENHIFHSFYVNSPNGLQQCLEKFNQAKMLCESGMSEEAREVAKAVKRNLSGYEVLYLPTYRRVEKPSESPRARARRGPLHGPSTYRPSLSGGKINYGLADVEKRLIELSEEIQRRTNFGYRKISTSIIDELVLQAFNISNLSSGDLPNIEQLETFFSRIGDARSEENRFAKIKQVYKEVNSKEENTVFLRYFLSKLSAVVKETSQLEGDIERFVQKSNSYLESSSDPKSFIYDPVQMKVSVINGWTKSEIKLDELSSGEKQVVSLLSFLFLYPINKIILIDEPELSLSIEWQQKIIPDIASSNVCSQLLAITHSPFVFENEFDECASALDIKRKSCEAE